MELLIDTHTALWWFDDPAQISQEAHDAISDLRNRVFVSAVVAWEIAIKRALGKLSAPKNLESVLQQNYFEPLAITIADALGVENLPLHHRDPFDRLLISQAIERGWTIISRDHVFADYSVKLIRA